MLQQHGKLVFIPIELNIVESLKPGSYFMFKMGEDVIRFNSVKGHMHMDISPKSWDHDLQLILFRRRPRPRNDSIGCRRRDILDYCSLRLNDIRPSKMSQYYAIWDSIHFALPSHGIEFAIQLEFYPTCGPIRPLKEIQPVPFERDEHVASCGNTSELQQKGSADCQFTSQRKTASHLRFFSKLRRHSTSLRSADFDHDDAENDIIYHSVIEYGNKASQQPKVKNYVHGTSVVHEKGPGSDDIYSFVKKNKDMIRNYDYDTLQLEQTPKVVLNNEYTRFRLGEKLVFTQCFPSANVKMTGYLGNGRWTIPQANETRLRHYVLQQPSLPAPKLPPKCPRGMMWEEYYLLDKDRYIKDVLRI